MEQSNNIITWNKINFFCNNNVFYPKESTIGILNEVESILPVYTEKVPIIDLCCGIGVIGISILLNNKNRFCKFYGFDNDTHSIDVCDKNIKFHSINGEVYLWEAGDKLFNIKKDGIVVCNPPFLPETTDKIYYKKSFITSGNNGLEVILKCFQSLNGTNHILILKSLKSQVPKILKEVNNDFRLIRQKEQKIESNYIIAFTTWRQKKQE